MHETQADREGFRKVEGGGGSLVLSPAAVSLLGVTINANVLENCNEL